MKQNIKIIKKCQDTQLIDKYYYGDVNLDEIHKQDFNQLAKRDLGGLKVFKKVMSPLADKKLE